VRKNDGEAHIGLERNSQVAAELQTPIQVRVVVQLDMLQTSSSLSKLEAAIHAGLSVVISLDCQSGVWKKNGGVSVGEMIGVDFNTTYCPGENAFLYAQQRSSIRDSQGFLVRVNGIEVARSVADTEGYHSYQTLSLILSVNDCFIIQPINGLGTPRLAWYRTL
jgi:hypothetical protein